MITFDFQEPIESLDGEEFLDIEQHGKLHMLSGGTKVVQHTPSPKTAPGLRGVCGLFYE